jgi:DNA invertase Pin-like site-specific DNA recombinase
MNKVAGYTRVSTEQQTTDNQIPAIEALCKARNWELVKVYSENASAWAGGRQTELARCIQDAQHNHFDTICVWSLDRVSREGPLRVLSLIEHLRRKGIKLVSVHESWTETAGEFAPVLYAITAWMADWESRRRSERTRAGIAEKRKHGAGRRGPDKRKRTRRWLKRPQIIEPIPSSVDG